MVFAYGMSAGAGALVSVLLALAVHKRAARAVALQHQEAVARMQTALDEAQAATSTEIRTEEMMRFIAVFLVAARQPSGFTFLRPALHRQQART